MGVALVGAMCITGTGTLISRCASIIVPVPMIHGGEEGGGGEGGFGFEAALQDSLFQRVAVLRGEFGGGGGGEAFGDVEGAEDGVLVAADEVAGVLHLADAVVVGLELRLLVVLQDFGAGDKPCNDDAAQLVDDAEFDGRLGGDGLCVASGFDGHVDEVVKVFLADAVGNDFLLDEAEVGEHTDEFFTRLVEVEVLLQDYGGGDEHGGGEVEVAGLAPEGDDLAALGVDV